MKQECEMTAVKPGRTSNRHRLVVPVSVVAAGLSIASAAFACAPGPQPVENDTRTLIQSCTAPAASGKVCKAMLDTPPFPEATAVKGPGGSRLIAYVKSGLASGVYDMVFSDSAKVSSGAPCHVAPFTVLAGPLLSDYKGGISPIQGTIPANAPLGAGQVCFAGRATAGSLPAKFKVVV